MKQQESQQMDSKFRSGARNEFGRQDNRRTSGDFRSTNRPSTFGAAGGARRPSKPVSETDDDGFTTVSTSKVKSSLSQAAAGQANAPRAPKIISKISSYAALAEETPASAKPTPEPLDKDAFQRRVGTIRNEYMQDPSNLEELFLSLDELSGTPEYLTQFVQVNCDRVVDCKDEERAAIYSLLALLVQQGKLSSDDFMAGVADLIEFIDSYFCDAPRAYEYLGDLLATMMKVKAVAIPFICEQAEKSKMGSDENPFKIMEALVSSMKKIVGADETKVILDANKSAIEALLGADKWSVIRSSL
jgi:hypothetical protein